MVEKRQDMEDRGRGRGGAGRGGGGETADVIRWAVLGLREADHLGGK